MRCLLGESGAVALAPKTLWAVTRKHIDASPKIALGASPD